jgi:phosphoglycolate phosphatase
MESAFRQTGLPPPDYDATRRVIGISLVEALTILAPPDIGAARLEILVDHYRNAFSAQRAAPDHHEPMYDGALDLLAQWKNDNWLLAIATGKTHRGLEGLFEKHAIRPMFDTVWCADDGPGKPNPFMVEQAMRTLGCAPAQSLMIGDAIHDMSMARAAGVRALGVSWGFGQAAELTEAGAHEVHHEFRTLTDSLTAFAPV